MRQAVSESYLSAELRRSVRSRANGRCEYCQIAEQDTWFGCEIDHIISEKHAGQTESDNLAFACATCNRAKGSDIAAMTEDGTLTALFHPRRQLWAEHFAREGAWIIGRTPVGRATVRLLKFNAPDRLAERE